jgi:AcrR family transcriptional regulator
MRAPERTQRAPGVATRQRLLDAGRTGFARDGVSGAATQDIVEAAGVAPTALYHHFGSKAGLFLAVSQEVYGQFVDGLAAAIDDADDFDDAIAALIRAAGQLHRADPTVAPMAITIQFEVQRSATLRRELADVLTSFRELAQRVARMASKDRLGPGGERAMTLAITGLMNGLCSLAATIAKPSDFAAATDSFARMFRLEPSSTPTPRSKPRPRRT